MDDSGSRDLDALLRAADPWPATRPVDPAIPARALALVEKELPMSESTPAPRRRLGRRGAVAIAISLAALALVGGTAIVRTTDGGPNVATGNGRAVGDAFASCLAFSLDVLARQPLAFDGTVTAVDGDEVTFDVERWFRGGEGDTAVTRAAGLVSGAPELNGGVGFVEGGRYLVSGEQADGAIVPAVCGLTMEYDSDMAADWATAFGK